MKRLVVLGAGTAGTMLANRVRRHLPRDWSLTVIDPDPIHLYQPGLLFLPFGARDESRMQRSRATTLGRGVDWMEQSVAAVDPPRRRIDFEQGGLLHYDLLVIASGSRIRPDLTMGMLDAEWGRTIHEFYTLDGARKLRAALPAFSAGRLVVNLVEMPIKCPVAPLEFLFLADDYFTRHGDRERVELVFVTPLDGAFTKPTAARVLAPLLARKGIRLETEFATERVVGAERKLVSYDGREVRYDLLVTIPTHSGAAFVEASGLGNELAFVPTRPASLRSKADEHLFVIGDATDLPTSKAGSVAHFQSEILASNLARAMAGRDPIESFDGHANCFIETGHGKALLIDFNYDVEPLPGVYPFPGLGPFRLLAESRVNHAGKLAFRSLYWNVLLPARPLPLSPRLSMAGKRRSAPPKGTQHAAA